MSIKFKIFTGLTLGLTCGFNMPEKAFKEYWVNQKEQKLKLKQAVDEKKVDPKEMGEFEMGNVYCYFMPTMISLKSIGVALIEELAQNNKK